jgi:ribulose-phosphate 3-epimerase
MDGHFVPNLTIGPNVVESIKRHSSVPLDVHLMVTNPEQYVRCFAEAGADIITVHVECSRALEALNKVHAVGVGSGVAISPQTDVGSVDAFIAHLDLVLVMTVQPGFAAQGFMPDQVFKIRYLYHKAAQLNKSNLLIAIDGGINDQTAKLCVEAGANMLVAGSYIFKSGDLYAEKIAALRYKQT